MQVESRYESRQTQGKGAAIGLTTSSLTMKSMWNRGTFHSIPQPPIGENSDGEFDLAAFRGSKGLTATAIQIHIWVLYTFMPPNWVILVFSYCCKRPVMPIPNLLPLWDYSR